MNKQHSKEVASRKPKRWIDSVDLELVFMNSIAICVIVIAIVALDFMAT